MEELEAEMAKVIMVLESRQEKRMLKNCEELINNWKNVHLEEDEMMFSLDVEKMFASLKRDEVRKEVGRLIKEGGNHQTLEQGGNNDNLDYIWDNQYCIIEGDIVKIKEGSRMSPVLA